MSNGNLRYYGLGLYAGLVALWTGLDKVALDDSIAIALLAPIAAVIGADYFKHKDDNKA
jgi:hypothetical protein